MNTRACAAIALLFACAAIAATQKFRANIVNSIELSTERPDGSTSVIKPNESVAIKVAGDFRFLLGVEIELRIPRAAQGLEQYMGFSAHAALSAGAEAGAIREVSGRELVFQPLPQRVSLVFQIPMRASHGLKSGAFATVLPTVSPQEGGSLLVSIVQLGKELPANAVKLEFSVRAKPLLSDEGAISLRIRSFDGQHPEASSIQAYLDDTPISPTAESIVARRGTHTLRIVSDSYRDYTSTFILERAKELVLDIVLFDVAPYLELEGPAGCLYSIDGGAFHPIPEKPVKLQEGEHFLSIRIGDYELSRRIVADRGKTIKARLAVELIVAED
jgi:hypothetical protein